MLAAFSTPMKARRNPGIEHTHPTLAPAPTPDATQHQLGKAEHAHLLTLRKPPRQRLFVRERVPPALQRMVERLNPPTYVLGRRWDVLAWNAAADELFAFSRLCDADRNILLSMLTDPAAKRLFGAAWSDEAQRMLALFRTTHDLWAVDPAFVDLLGRLRMASSEFSGWWQTHEVRGIVAGSKWLNHPTRGAVLFEYVTFQSNDDPALKLVIYTPV